jgi:hypothetical protein
MGWLLPCGLLSVDGERERSASCNDCGPKAFSIPSQLGSKSGRELRACRIGLCQGARPSQGAHAEEVHAATCMLCASRASGKLTRWTSMTS